MSSLQTTTGTGVGVTARLICRFRGYVVFGVDVDRGERLQITVSPAGQSVRIFDSQGREWKPVKEEAP